MFASAGPPAITSTEQLYIHVTCVQHQQQQNVNTVKHTAAYNITRQPPPCWHVLDLFVSLQVAGCDVAASAGFDGYLAAELWLFKPQPCLQWHPWPMRVSPPPLVKFTSTTWFKLGSSVKMLLPHLWLILKL
jgi:hypothetical protein